MKITMYELLGLVKDGKAPKRIKLVSNDYNKEFYFDGDIYIDEEGYAMTDDISIEMSLNDKVEIKFVEKEKKIPEKLEEFGLIQYSLDYIDYKNIETLKEWLNKDFQTIYDTLDLLIKNQNKLIDYLKSKGE